MINLRSILLSSVVALTGAANAQVAQEWRFMGPAFSQHLSDEGRLIRPDQAGGERFKRWVENNPALGLRYTRRLDSHADSAFASVVRDSYGSHSLMAGGARTWPLLSAGSFSAEAGLVGGVWWRTIPNRAETKLERALVPFVLPIMTFAESSTGLGLDVAFAPRVSVGGRVLNRVPTFMYQVTYLVRKVGPDKSLKLGLERTKSGGLLATFSRTF